MLWGILNPNGPTLYCLGEREVNGNRRVFFRWLHMLGGCTTYAGRSDPENLSYQDVFEDAIGISNHRASTGQPGLMPFPPSFLMINAPYSGLTNVAKCLLQDGPAASADWGKELSYLRAFDLDFFARAGCEIRGVYDREKAKALAEDKPLPDYLRFLEHRYGNVPEFRDARMPEFESSKLTQPLFEEWWSVITRPEHKRAALGTLATMWSGAISVMSDDMQKGAIAFQKVAEFLARYHVQFPN